MNWYSIKDDYIDYIKQADNLVPNVSYGSNKTKCFLGIIVINNNFNYFIPLTSYKEKFKKIREGADFYKLKDQAGKVYAALNINNMIPVPDNMYELINKNNLYLFRDFKNYNEQRQYWDLLKKELKLIDENEVQKRAAKLRSIFETAQNKKLISRCCNFKLLEERCLEYERSQKKEYSR